LQQSKILLERDYLNDSTIGCLSYIKNGKLYQFSTLEPIWLDNKKNISCIPEGEFNVMKYPSQRFGSTYLVSVPDRSGILFHAGNTKEDTQGCILVGDYFEMHRQTGLYLKESKKAFKEFLESLKDVKTFTLLVKKRA
jgi:Family of unknown function (DUF5675)